MEDTEFVHNDNVTDASAYGPVFVSGVATFRRCDFTNNFGDTGGAIWSQSAMLLVEDCVFKTNHAIEAGAVHGKGTYRRCRFESNFAGMVGGACQPDGTPQTAKFINCDFITNFCNGFGGAVYSAVKYFATDKGRSRFLGNVLIAIGAFLPGIGGTFTRFGYVEVLYITELIGLIFIYFGYHVIRIGHSASLHANQQTWEGPLPVDPRTT